MALLGPGTAAAADCTAALTVDRTVAALGVDHTAALEAEYTVAAVFDQVAHRTAWKVDQVDRRAWQLVLMRQALQKAADARWHSSEVSNMKHLC
jgi:hypothetical protein